MLDSGACADATAAVVYSIRLSISLRRVFFFEVQHESVGTALLQMIYQFIYFGGCQRDATDKTYHRYYNRIFKLCAITQVNSLMALLTLVFARFALCVLYENFSAKKTTSNLMRQFSLN